MSIYSIFYQSCLHKTASRVSHAFIPELAKVAEAISHHHERWDGSGYPDRLKGDQIPLLVRILSIIDAYDVMTHHRPYVQTFTQEEALKELLRNVDKQFDPELVDLFIKIISKHQVAACR